MTANDHVDLLAVFHIIQAFAGGAFPGDTPVELSIKFATGKQFVSPLPAGCQAARTNGPVMSAIETAIIDALTKLPDGRTLTGEKLAEAADYPFNGRFKDTLALLVRAGKIVNDRPGYRLPEPE